ncbi:16S rRNA (guanine(527)-N(7))-methyltransferase RsmG [Xiamenia xianingshaonis]|uniref:Ribosomal RNA small subunit methyltransferase G n=1 Tax=Xiamenia xianingshaonis TaxID=2682776 RepID=A0A9E6MQ62_9ACTN|nr:16S rRNA (guanine(527)-N(7))-methyltransferase RsmG [Xiamenia xianingshaonis]NHM13938.1 16S rRNA (guanine(527)-N(7))-methyltransferase RsmG [Xiamenia xianingshaonis]QTU84378.1 16S rRNA (guanine(527)-N(7))-methyltransferase RsmG [Xiamenia xianingshaonis]
MNADELLKRHLELVLEANKTTNITAIDSWDDGMKLHVEDSLVGLPELEAAPAGPFADIGSGAGYPGIPLAVMTGREALLVDSVKKKARLLESFVQELGLENVAISDERIEDASRQFRGRFSAVTARALSKLSVLMELAQPLLAPGGHLICYKARMEEEELVHALSLQKRLGYRVKSDRTIDADDRIRRIIVLEKVGEPALKLPRHVGYAQKRPL